MIALHHMQVLEIYQSANELSQAVQDNCNSSKIKVMTAVINLQIYFVTAIQCIL
jgi:hypothetical protein